MIIKRTSPPQCLGLASSARYAPEANASALNLSAGAGLRFAGNSFGISFQ
jgi:hypothetical protein